ncbi:Uncharacterised protein [Vibrio cholerae]|nr:Uncharacterised protein [Vibrio cholerae]
MPFFWQLFGGVLQLLTIKLFQLINQIALQFTWMRPQADKIYDTTRRTYGRK